MDEMELGMEALTEELADAAPEEEVVRNFATIGEVFEDGVSLIFDGEEEPTEKHYLCNTNVYFQAGDRVRILADGGTYIVEYVVGAPRQQPIHQVPGTGTTGHVLTKTNSGYEWKAVPIEDRLANLGVQSSLQTNNSYVIQFKTGGTSGTAASTFYIRMGTSGTWHQITTT